MGGNKRNSSIYLAVLILYTFVEQGCLNGMNPHVASFAAKFSDIPLTTIMLLATIPLIVLVPTAALLQGPLVKALKLKGTLIFGLSFFLVGGLIPLLNPDSFAFLVVSRVIFGVGYGIVNPLCATLVTAYYQGDKANKMMGFGTVFVNVGSILFALIGTYLATIALDDVYYVHLIMVIPLVMAFFMKEPEVAVTATQESGEKVKKKLSGATWGFIILMSVFMVFFYPIYVYSSPIIVDNHMGTAEQAALVLTFVAVGGMGSMVFGYVYGKIGKRMITLSAVVSAAGCVCVFLAHTMPIMYLGAFLLSLGFFWVYSAAFVIMSEVTHPSLVPTANGILMAAINLMGFFSTYLFSFLSSVFGKAGDLRFPFLISTIVYLIVGVAFLLKKQTNKNSKVEAV